MSDAQAQKRPPLYLTESEAAVWFSLHSEDRGREIIIVTSPIRQCPSDQLDAWANVGRWETGLYGGVWPRRTFVQRSMVEHPPRLVTVVAPENGQVHGDSVVIRIQGAMSVAEYRVHQRSQDPVIQAHVDHAGPGILPAELMTVR
jgi:hypothetical protein